MKNQSVSDFVAATMDAVLNSKEHKSLFDTQYKFAQDQNAAKKDEDKDSCMADDDDNDVRRAKKKNSDDESSADDDDNDARKKNSDESSADDDNDAKKKKMPPWLKKDDSDADDNDDKGASDPVVSNNGAVIGWKQPAQISVKPPAKADDHSADMEPSIAFDVAIDSLLTASAALDALNLGRGSAYILKIASLVVEAKKKDKNSKKSKKDSKDSKKSSKDSQSAKDKKSKDSKKSSDKKSSDKKDDKKSSKPSSSSEKKKVSKAQRFGDDYEGSPEQFEQDQHAPPMGGDDEALQGWQGQEDAHRHKLRLEMGNAWRVLSKGSNFFMEDDSSEYAALNQAIKQVHDAMNDLEINKKMNFFELGKDV